MLLFQTVRFKELLNGDFIVLFIAWWWVRLGSGDYQFTAWTAKCACCKGTQIHTHTNL